MQVANGSLAVYNLTNPARNSTRVSAQLRGNERRMKQDPLHSEAPLVLSVVIPVYNEVSTIGRMILEVVGAVPEIPKQIVIVDDSSTDGT